MSVRISNIELKAIRISLDEDNFKKVGEALSPAIDVIFNDDTDNQEPSGSIAALYLEFLFRTCNYGQLATIVNRCIADRRYSQLPRVQIYRAWLMYHSSHYDEALQLSKRHLTQLGLLSLADSAEFLRISGMSSLRLGKKADSIRDIRDSVALYRADNSISGQVSSLVSLGFAHIAFSNYQPARTVFHEALSLTEKRKNTLRRAEVLHNLAILEFKIGHSDKSTRYLIESGSIYAKYGQKLSLIRVQIQQSRQLLAEGQYSESNAVLVKALALAQELGFSREESLSLETLGDIAAKQEKTTTASRYYERAKSIGETIAPEGDLVAENMRRLASLRLQAGDAFESIPLLKEAITFAKKCDERFEIGIAYRHLSQAYRQLNQHQQAVKAARESVEIFEAMGARLELAHSRFEAANACRAWYHDLSTSIEIGTAIDNPNPYTHLESAWNHVIEAFHGYSDLEREDEARACERLMDQLHTEGRPIWLRGTRAPRDGKPLKVNAKPFIANAPSMKQLIALVDVSASTTEPVLITGETGTGKELIARLIHEKSDRTTKPFVPINCAAIPESLFEREFFGHARGAFTGAEGEHPGLCEAADGGTMFLDEIGDMPPYLQVKLLRMLQEGAFHRLGDPEERRADLRIIAATNASLPDLIAGGTFRQDLYYRLQTLEMTLPPLRERPEDLEPLIRLFMTKIIGEELDPRELFDRDVMTVLEHYPWPGNVRELEAMTRRLALLARHSGRATIEMLPETMRKWRNLKPAPTGSLHLTTYLEKVERERIGQALLIKGGNRSEAARALGISRNQLYRKLQKYGIRLPV